jgi:hypothetical protein
MRHVTLKLFDYSMDLIYYIIDISGIGKWWHNSGGEIYQTLEQDALFLPVEKILINL